MPVTRTLTADEIKADYELNTGKVIVERFRTGGINPDNMPAILVAGHAPFVWGATPEKALENAIALEYIAGMQIETYRINAQSSSDAPLKGISQSLLDKHFLRKHGAAATYGQAEKK